jgi:hypothetical protein
MNQDIRTHLDYDLLDEPQNSLLTLDIKLSLGESWGTGLRASIYSDRRIIRLLGSRYFYETSIPPDKLAWVMIEGRHKSWDTARLA